MCASVRACACMCVRVRFTELELGYILEKYIRMLPVFSEIYKYIYLHLGRPVVLRLSYCNPRSNPQRDCKRGELALTVQGFGPIMFQDVGRMKCRCLEPLSMKRSRPLGYFFREQEYVCGQVCL